MMYIVCYKTHIYIICYTNLTFVHSWDAILYTFIEKNKLNPEKLRDIFYPYKENIRGVSRDFLIYGCSWVKINIDQDLNLYNGCQKKNKNIFCIEYA